MKNIRTLFWRNSNLNFNNSLSLIKSLEEKPQTEWLKKIHECEDERALKYFLKDKSLIGLEFNKENTQSFMGMLPNTRFC